MKYQFIFIIVITHFVCLYSIDHNILEGVYSESHYGDIVNKYKFSDNVLTHIVREYDNTNKKYIEQKNNYYYTIESINGVDYIIIDELSNKYLVLIGESFIYLYGTDGDLFFEGEKEAESFSLENLFFNFDPPIVASSSLIENMKGRSIIYSSDNLSNKHIPAPWVEAEIDYGIGESLKMIVPGGNDIFSTYLYISNGYVSYTRPDLYEKNSRLKEIKIRNITNNMSKNYSIEDNPHFQKLDLSNILERGKNMIIVEIVDIYEGTLYTDTCVNLLGYYMEF